MGKNTDYLKITNIRNSIKETQKYKPVLQINDKSDRIAQTIGLIYNHNQCLKVSEIHLLMSNRIKLIPFVSRFHAPQVLLTRDIIKNINTFENTLRDEKIYYQLDIFTENFITDFRSKNNS